MPGTMAAVDEVAGNLSGLGYARPMGERAFIHIADGETSPARAIVAEETPVALVYNGRPHVVVMATPCDLEDLAVGFSCTEGIVDHGDEIQRIAVAKATHGIELQIEIAPALATRLESKVRSLASRTGCGLCGVETIAEALRVPPRVQQSLVLSREALWDAGAELSRRQEINRSTNTVHGAAWAGPDGTVRLVREDVGRHNALDKVLGALARQPAAEPNGFIVVTSRASYEMVQKAAMRGVELVAAVSRPTGLAIRFAEAAGVTLVGLLRGRSANVYCGMERIS